MLESTLETIAIATAERRTVYTTGRHIEAPNWSRDGKYFLFNSNGRIERLSVGERIRAAVGERLAPSVVDTKVRLRRASRAAVGSVVPEKISTGFAVKCNNDHGLSPDGKFLAISDQTRNDTSLISIVPAGGGEPRLVTPNGPSYWHGWSPDGKTLAYCAQRGGEYDIYTIPADGGVEKQLTKSPGLDDGPDYSPDGEYIYFNSERTGRMQVWRMKTDGSAQEQITFDEYNNWFPHPSPDGKWIVFLSYEKDVKGHPANKDVMLRLIPTGGGEIRTLAKLFGGQGTINVPSWSPDSDALAFVGYRIITP